MSVVGGFLADTISRCGVAGQVAFATHVLKVVEPVTGFTFSATFLLVDMLGEAALPSLQQEERQLLKEIAEMVAIVAISVIAALGMVWTLGGVMSTRIMVKLLCLTVVCFTLNNLAIRALYPPAETDPSSSRPPKRRDRLSLSLSGFPPRR